MIYLKKHDTDRGAMIAMCDEKALGKIYRDTKTGAMLDLKKYSDFYKGELMDAERAGKEVSKDYIYSANIVGGESVGVILDAGLASEVDVKEIGGVRTLQIYRIS